MKRTAVSVFGLLGLLLLLALLHACAEPLRPTLEVTPSSRTVVSGERFRLTVTRRFPGAEADDVTDEAEFVSTSPERAAVTNGGEIGQRGWVSAGIEVGSVVIRVKDPVSHETTSVELVVVAAAIQSIEVSPSPAVVLGPGTTRQLTALARLANGTTRDVTSQVQWASSSEAVASVGRTQGDAGRVLAIAEGDTSITATDAATLVQGRSIVFVRGGAPILRAIAVTPNPATLGIGPTKTLQLVATGILENGATLDLTKAVTWQSSRTDIATIDVNGLATGILAGDATFSAIGLGASANVRGSTEGKVQ